MAEKIVSPGVFTKENDMSFVQSGVGAIGAAVIGPTVKGPALIPTQVFTYGEYQTLFGDSFKSGSDYYQYLTSMAAKDYLKHGGPLTVTRILPDGFTNADAFVHTAATSNVGDAPSGSITFVNADFADGDPIIYSGSNGVGYNFIGETDNVPADNASINTYYFLSTGVATADTPTLAAKMNTILGTSNTFLGTLAVLDFTGSVISTGIPTANIFGDTTTVVTTANGVASTSSFNATNEGVPNSGSSDTAHTHSFKIETHAHGLGMNSRPLNAHGTGSNNILTSNAVKYGTKDNIRWEVSNINENKGTFTLSIRRGDDTDKRKVILESFSNCSLDPQASNYLGKKVGTSYKSYDPTNGIVKSTGTYPNMSKFIYITEASIANTVDYLDDNGAITNPAYTASLPKVSNGTFANGLDGSGAGLNHPQKFYQEITTANNQGLKCGPVGAANTGTTSYMAAINLLANQDEYDVNLVFAPGINHTDHPAISNALITMCENRGDCMVIVDPVAHDSTVKEASTVAGLLDSSYAAMYWPWVQVADPSTGKYVYVPQATVMPGIYAFNDKVSAEWFAPAGLNRGGQESVIQAEVKLTHAHRDTMYENNLNPVATFPGEGVVVWGQKTLQKKASALDRVNVRRLLINLKKFIASTSKYLVFENNTDATRNRFLSTVNPYMESVQQRQGLYAFKVVMDATNNTPDIIDQNILKGDIFLQPAKAAEFIVIDFNVMPTGATFND
jgi:hypothetical protein